LELVEEAISLATEQRYSFWLDVAYIIRGFVLAVRGDTAEGLLLARKAATDRATTGSIGGQTYFLGLLAQICESASQPDEAHGFLRDALDMAERTGERWFEPELHRLRGEWLIARRPEEYLAAEASFRRALLMAQQQGAKLWALRAAVSLGGLWFSRGKLPEAYAILVPIYESFTEGWDTADLREADQF